MRDLAQCSPAKLSQLRAELTDLRKFVVLNYIAVIKAAKKRNRHLKVICLWLKVACLWQQAQGSSSAPIK